MMSSLQPHDTTCFRGLRNAHFSRQIARRVLSIVETNQIHSLLQPLPPIFPNLPNPTDTCMTTPNFILGSLKISLANSLKVDAS